MVAITFADRATEKRALAFLLGVTAAVDAPVRQSFVPEMVGTRQLPNAVALGSATFNLGRVLGPATE